MITLKTYSKTTWLRIFSLFFNSKSKLHMPRSAWWNLRWQGIDHLCWMLLLWGQKVKTSASLLKNTPINSARIQFPWCIFNSQVHYSAHYLNLLSVSTHLLLTSLDEKTYTWKNNPWRMNTWWEVWCSVSHALTPLNLAPVIHSGFGYTTFQTYYKTLIIPQSYVSQEIAQCRKK